MSPAPWRMCHDGRPIEDGLAAMLDSGRCILLVSRSSSAHGGDGQRLAIDDLYGAADNLASRLGIDLTRLLPSKESLGAQLSQQSRRRVRTSDGSSMSVASITIDLSESHQVVALVILGSGRQVDEDYDSPVAQLVNDAVRTHQPALLAVKRFDRLSREPEATPWALRFREMGGWLVDEDGAQRATVVQGLFTYIKAAQAHAEALQLVKKSRDGQFNLTGDRLVDGQVAYHAAQMPPPGTAVVTMRGTGPRADDRVLYLDTESCRPPPDEVASGAPAVFGPDGRPVDQVALTREILSLLGRPEWPVQRLVPYMQSKGYSTPGLRSHRQDRSATIDTPAPILTILRRLDEYENQRIVVRLGARELTIRDFVPPDGRPWAETEDFERIRRHIADGDRTGWARLPLSGTAVTLNGDPGILLAESTPSHGEPTRYRIVDGSRYPEAKVILRRRTFVQVCDVEESIISSLQRHGDAALVVAETVGAQPDRQVVELGQQVARLEREVAELDDRRLRLRDRVLSGGTDSDVSGSLLRDLSAEYNRIVDELLPTRESALQDLRQTLAGLHGQPVSEAAPVAALLQLVATLRDPNFGQAGRALWRSAIERLDFATTGAKVDGYAELEWTGQMCFAVGASEEIVIPLEGATKSSPAPQGRMRATTSKRRPSVAQGFVIDQLRRGESLTVRQRSDPPMLLGLAQYWGLQPEELIPIIECDDPLLLKVIVEYFDNCRGVDVGAKPVVAPAKLRDRVAAICADPPGRWLRQVGRIEVAMHVIASDNGSATARDVAELAETTTAVVYTSYGNLRADAPWWTSQRKRGYRLQPCTCGSFARSPSTLREVAGLLCLACRHDMNGVQWDRNYDRYMPHRELWAGGEARGRQPTGS